MSVDCCVSPGPGLTALTRMPVPHELEGRRLDQIHDAGLRRVVVREQRAAAQRGDGRRELQAAAGAAVPHGPSGALADGERRVEVDRHDPEPRLVLHVDEGLLGPGRGVGDRHVEPAGGGDRLADGPVAALDGAEVGSTAVAFAPRSRISAVTRASRSSSRSTIVTCAAPSSAKRSAVARPKPLPPPVIRTRFPACLSVSTLASLRTVVERVQVRPVRLPALELRRVHEHVVGRDQRDVREIPGRPRAAPGTRPRAARRPCRREARRGTPHPAPARSSAASSARARPSSPRSR